MSAANTGDEPSSRLAGKVPARLRAAARLLRRLRRAAALALRYRQIARFAGGHAALARVVLGLWRQLGFGAMLGWAVAAVAHGQYLDGAGYAAWRRRQLRRPRRRGDGSALVVVSTLGLDDGSVESFLRLLRQWLAGPSWRALPGECLLVTDDRGAAVLRSSENAAPLPHQRCAVATAATLSVDAALAAVKDRASEQDYLALLSPGYLPADIELPEASAPLQLFYGNEDRIGPQGARSHPAFKPAFSPDLLFAREYFACMILPRELAAALPDKAADHHSLALQLVERADRVSRLDAVLASRFGQAVAADAAPAFLGRFLRNRYGAAARVEEAAGEVPPWRCGFGNDAARVSVILPTRDRLALLRNCVEGVFASNRGNFEVVVLNNDSQLAETRQWLAEAPQRWPALRVVDAPGEFNWSALNNLGLKHASGDVFVFLNNDTEPRCDDWLQRLADVALRPDAGAVGALLLYGNGRIQHAGVVVGEGARTDHIYRGDFPSGGEHAFVPPNLPRNVSAVTGACMALARRTIDAIGAFDEGYRVAGGDVEICIRAMRHGYLNVYLPDVVLLHLESQTRGRRDPPEDVDRLAAFLRASCPEDPFFSPHLAGDHLGVRRLRASGAAGG